MACWDSYLRDKFGSKSYPNATQALNDAKTALDQYKTLKPNLKHFVFPDGRSKELVCLEGTIPVNYRGATYNIPVCIWLQEKHPFIPPLAYVVPTSAMEIKTGRHVDHNGRIYLPFLTDWKHPGSDLFGLIQLLCLMFAEEPPVFARTTPVPTAHPPAGQPPRYPGYPQYPSNQLPPGFYQSGPVRMPMPGMPQGPPQTNTPYPTNTQTNTPYPTTTPANTPYPSNTPTPYPTTSLAQGPARSTPPERPPPPSRPPQPYPPQGGFPIPAVSQANNQSYPNTQNYPPTTTAAPELSRNTQSSFKITPDMLRASLKSGVEDKIRRRLNEVFAQAQVEMESLKKTEHELNEGKRKLGNMIHQIETEEVEVSKDIETLKQKNKEIEETVATLQQQSEKMNIDEAVVPTTPLYSQILELYAEENSLDDTMYYLGEALRREKIELDVFLKHVRSLSRKQFMSRALLQKARRTAGLSEL